MHKVLSAAVDSNLLSSESFIDECCQNNLDYSTTYDQKIYDFRAPPSKHLAVICCMDARLDVFRMLGLKPGEAHIIRNGGGRIRDAVRSLICSQTLLQTKEVMIIHHTDCGFTYFSSNEQVLAALKLQPGTNTGEVSLFKTLTGQTNPNDVPDFQPIKDLEQSVRDDLLEYKQYPMLNQNVTVRGFLYDTKTGILKEIK
ncbi:unnamed protein product [Didymodactylos carnosus]|uniref:Carbonic anhydrase n=1 Tax=Didymodactylos carnosus TaxID=1234261 RepID=A0A815VFT7_9BILA|nr:unnamed protein product [Didymodactylos carnosus]CAF1527651.1 unnamed protein product [Didymodactylos carnosus]CAF3647282.1 unnamed protein product [Didymodactylos carnosus]CAF4386770.1 unnamed protein product [Didymodactylos carnosus]